MPSEKNSNSNFNENSNLPITDATFDSKNQLALVLGGGGLRAMCAGSGVAALLTVLGLLEQVKLFLGCSGGSIVSTFLAAGIPVNRILQLLIKTDLSKLITSRGWPTHIFARLITDNTNHFVIRPAEGLYSTERVGKFMENVVPIWPKGLVCPAVDGPGTSEVLFTDSGVYEFYADGRIERISDQPWQVGSAVRASIAIPIVFSSVMYKGQDGKVKRLHDGAFALFGRAPVANLISFYNVHPENIIVVDTWDEPRNHPWWQRMLWDFVFSLLCDGICPMSVRFPPQFQGTMLIQPITDSALTMQFSASSDAKWTAIMAGFAAGIPILEESGLANGESLAKAKQIVRIYEQYRQSWRMPGELSRWTEQLMAENGLW